MNQRKIFVVFGDSDVIVLSFWPYLVMPESRDLITLFQIFKRAGNNGKTIDGWKKIHMVRGRLLFLRFFFWSIFRKKNGCGDAFFQAHMRTMRPKHPTAAAGAIAVVVQLFSADDG